MDIYTYIIIYIYNIDVFTFLLRERFQFIFISGILLSLKVPDAIRGKQKMLITHK